MATLALGNGQPDSFFVSEVRRIFRDQPTYQNDAPASDGTVGAYASAASKPLHLQRSPVRRSIANQGPDPGVRLTAPPGANQTGLTAYVALFDPPPPTPMPMPIPSISDGGAGGALAAATYQVLFTYIIGGGTLEVGMSALSNSLVIAANHRITVAALSSLPAAVNSVNYYIATSTAGGSSVGFVGNQAVVSGAVPAFTFGVSGNTTVPALIFSDTGELVFPVAPAVGTVQVSYQTARYSDQQILDALYEGLGMLWPEIWSYQPADTTSVLPSSVQYEYVLPAAPYGDPKTIITEVETRPPQAWVRFRRISGWRKLDDPVSPTLIFERTPPTGGQVRITAVQPFQQLADVPSVGATGILLPPANLPVYYACARLLADAEVMRSRADDLPALTGENAGAEKGGHLQTAAWYLQNLFAPELNKVSIGRPARRTIQSRIVERLNLSGIWQEAA